MSKVYRYFSNRFYFFISLLKIKKIKSIGFFNESGLILRGAGYSDLKQIRIIYKNLNGSDFSRSNKILLKYCEKKLIIVAEKRIKDELVIVGMDMFYLNPRDFKESTVHEGFIGVLPEFEGQGIATKMRKYAMEHFKNAGFYGISSRISKNNLGSLNSAKKLGFEPVEQYTDPVTGLERYYLINWFDK